MYYKCVNMKLVFVFVIVNTFIRSSLTLRKRLHENDICFNNDGTEGVCRRLDRCSTGASAIKAGRHPKICSFAGDNPIVCCPPEYLFQPTRTPTRSPWGRPETTPQQPDWESPQSSPSWSRPASSSSSSAILKAKQKCAEFAKSIVLEVDSPILSASKPTKEVIDLCARVEEPLVVGGINTKPREYPHMALIGYKERDPQWLCGGSLISEQYVLSAAHCSNPGRKGPAMWAKLGELDTSTELDDASPEIIRIISRKDHPQYNSVTLYNDISLFKLERKVNFNAYIRPICLSTTDDIPWKTAIATGWGHTAWGGIASPSLMKVRLDLVSTEKCNQTYGEKIGRQIPKGILGESMICAGDKPGKDTCQGDSGGPLQIPIDEPYCMYDLIGLTSFGKSCGNGYPGVYTRISHYVPWIVQNIWPE